MAVSLDVDRRLFSDGIVLIDSSLTQDHSLDQGILSRYLRISNHGFSRFFSTQKGSSVVVSLLESCPNRAVSDHLLPPFSSRLADMLLLCLLTPWMCPNIARVQVSCLPPGQLRMPLIFFRHQLNARQKCPKIVVLTLIPPQDSVQINKRHAFAPPRQTRVIEIALGVS